MSEIRYSANLDLSTVGCTACGKFNLSEYLCHNCKQFLECTSCCGCDELEGEEESQETCVECGNDLAAEGQKLCLECLEISA
jgi:hypothetical protein